MWLYTCKVLCLLIYSTACLSSAEVVLVLPDGKIKGRIETTDNNTTFYSFQGIPYAEPPVGDLRFMAPRPAQPWEGIVDGTYLRNICYQVTVDRSDESEDCLFLNVYTPWDLASAATFLPVMFFIHGGGFMSGSSERSYYSPEPFMDYSVVVVTFNYRLGPFGFFSSGDNVISGNAGLKDQNMALRWVHKNIEFFGGDPGKVTIFGQGAGAASVGYHILSPTSEGLFRAAICESGSALSPWGFQLNEMDITYETAGLINDGASVKPRTSHDLLNYLRTIPADMLDDASYLLYIKEEKPQYLEVQQGYFFAPVVESYYKDAFIWSRMVDTLEYGQFNQVPLMMGITSEEALFFLDEQAHLGNITDAFDQDNTLLNPLDMNIDDDDAIRVARRVKRMYAPHTTFTEDPMRLIKYFSDQSYSRSAIRHAGVQSFFTDVFFYQFSYSGVLGGHATESVEGFSDSVRHGEDLNYLFRRNNDVFNTTDLSQFPDSDVLVMKRLLTMFTNFAKTLNPTPEEDVLLENVTWPTLNATAFPYLDIGSQLEVKQSLKQDVYEAWGNTFLKYGGPPYYTY